MANVPSHTRTRNSHRKTYAAGTVNSRRTHSYSDSYLGPITGAEEVYDQAVIDDDPAAPAYYPPASIPASAVDAVAPAPPTIDSFNSDVSADSDGHAVLRLRVSITHPNQNSDGTALTDLFATLVEVTADNDNDPENPQPVWQNALVLTIGKDATTAAVEGVRGQTMYWARAQSLDIFGNRSNYSTVTSHVTGKDNEAPDQPQSVVLAPAFKGFGIGWDSGAPADLMFYQIRYAVDDGSGVSPDEEAWQFVTTRSNTIIVTNLAYATKYWVQVRAVDLSGNVVTSAVDSTAVNYVQNPEAGWTGLNSVIPAQVGTTDIAVNSIVSDHIVTAGLSADVIKTGYLKVNTTDGTMIDGIEIWNAGIRIGKWDETGLYIGKTSEGLPTDLSGSDYVKVTDAGITVYLDGVATSAITPDGINATAVNFGALPGGHNLLQNSSFELADFAAAASTATWDVSADWTGTVLATTNVTTSAENIAMTASTY